MGIHTFVGTRYLGVGSLVQCYGEHGSLIDEMLSSLG